MAFKTALISKAGFLQTKFQALVNSFVHKEDMEAILPSGIQNGQILVWNQSTQSWVPVNPPNILPSFETERLTHDISLETTPEIWVDSTVHTNWTSVALEFTLLVNASSESTFVGSHLLKGVAHVAYNEGGISWDPLVPAYHNSGNGTYRIIEQSGNLSDPDPLLNVTYSVGGELIVQLNTADLLSKNPGLTDVLFTFEVKETVSPSISA